MSSDPARRRPAAQYRQYCLVPRKRVNLGLPVALNSGQPYTMSTGTDPYRTGMANARRPGVARNGLQGPGYADLDLRVALGVSWDSAGKEERGTAAFALDAFDVFNQVNYAGYVGEVSSQFFERPVLALPTRRSATQARFKF